MEEDFKVVGDDPSCGTDTRFQHLKHFFMGYRATILDLWGPEDSPFSPGSAKDRSWRAGCRAAHKDHPFSR